LVNYDKIVFIVDDDVGDDDERHDDDDEDGADLTEGLHLPLFMSIEILKQTLEILRNSEHIVIK